MLSNLADLKDAGAVMWIANIVANYCRDFIIDSKKISHNLNGEGIQMKDMRVK